MIFKNWKTTTAGLAIGAINLFVNGATWQAIVVSVGFAALGAFAKDHDVTGVSGIK